MRTGPGFGSRRPGDSRDGDWDEEQVFRTRCTLNAHVRAKWRCPVVIAGLRRGSAWRCVLGSQSRWEVPREGIQRAAVASPSLAGAPKSRCHKDMGFHSLLRGSDTGTFENQLWRH